MSNQWYSFYVGDYQRKTAHLSLLEHGAYRLLIDHYMATQLPLPSDTKLLYRICRAFSPSERNAVNMILREFFVQIGTLLHHEKCDSELDKQRKFSNSQSAKAKLRHSRGNATALPTTTTTTEVSKKEKKESKTLGSRFALTELPEDWRLFCQTTRPDLNPDEVFAEFADYWRGISGWRGRKLDWIGTWRNRVREKKKSGGNYAITSGYTTKTKTERLRDAAIRAAESGGFAPGSPGTSATDNDAVSVFPIS